MLQKIELRIHAGASSRHTDDERHEAQALAYQSFTALRTTDIHRTQTTRAQRASTWQASGNDNVELDAGIVSLDDISQESHCESERHITPVRPDDTTFVEETQLAFTALESQLFTSSLTVPDFTPGLSVQRFEDEESEVWPEDLDRQSPSKASFERQCADKDGVRQHTHCEDELSEIRPVPTSSPPPRSLHESGGSPEYHFSKLRGHGKRRNVKEGPVFKPFQLPLKRSATDLPRPTTPPALVVPVHRTESAPVSTPSSYLKTPILNRSSTRLPRRDTVSFHDAASKVTPEGYVASQSMALSSPELGRSVKRQRLADYRERTPRQALPALYFPLHRDSRRSLALPHAPSQNEHAQPANQTRSSQASNAGHETTSELPTSYGLSSTATEIARARLRASQRSTSDPGPQLSVSSDDLLSRHDVARSQPGTLDGAADISPHTLRTAQKALDARAAAKRCLQDPVSPQALPDPVGPQVRASEQLDTTSRLAAKATTDELASPNASTADLSAVLKDLPLIIRPAEPCASLDPVTTHITTSLRLLTDSPHVKDSYKPIYVSRGIRSQERGYWLLEGTSSWPVSLQVDFWRFLQQFVGSGNGGWGIWCLREPSLELRNLGDVKVYCWGEVVKHVYLLLYTASQSKVRKMGLQWLDADERIIVRMRAKS